MTGSSVEDLVFGNRFVVFQVLANICSYLPQGDLYSLSMVSREFYALVTPRLYRSITITESQDHDMGQADSTFVRTTEERSSLHAAKLLLRSLLENHRLCAYVKEIKVKEDVWFTGAITGVVNCIGESSCSEHALSIRCDHEHPPWFGSPNKSCYRCLSFNRVPMALKGCLVNVQCQSMSEFENIVSNGTVDCLHRLREVELYELPGGYSICSAKEDDHGKRVFLKKLKSFVRRIEKLTLLYGSHRSSFLETIYNDGDAFEMPNLQSLSLDVDISEDIEHHGTDLTSLHDFLHRHAHTLKKIRFRFKYADDRLFQQYLKPYLSHLHPDTELDLVICVRDCAAPEAIAAECLGACQSLKVQTPRMAIYNDTHEYYIE